MNENTDRKVIKVTSELPVQRTHSTEFHWGRCQVHALIRKVEDFFEDFYDGSKKKKFIWNAVAEQMQKEGYNCTGSECDKKWRNLKGTYVKVLQKQIHGDTDYKFEYFDALHHILGKEIDPLGMREQVIIQGEALTPEVKTSRSDYHEITSDGGFMWTELAVCLLLDLILKNRDALHSPSMCLNDVWVEISQQMAMHGQNVQGEQCQLKWINLQEGFQFYHSEAEASGSPPQWTFYERVKEIKELLNVNNNFDHKPLLGDIGTPIHPTGTRGRGSGVCRAGRGGEPLRVKDKSILGRVRQVETTYNISRRLEHLESQVKSAYLQHDTFKQTNNILSQILTKLQKINNVLEQEQSSQSNQGVGQNVTHHHQLDQDSGSPNQGIIIVETYSDTL